MFNQAWKKYLPVITILLKRSSTGDQQLSMNNTDFERAAGGRKIKFSFNHLHISNGRVNNTSKHTPLAKDLALLLQEDDQILKLLLKQEFEFSMTNDFNLWIKNNTPPAEVVAEEEITAAITGEA